MSYGSFRKSDENYKGKEAIEYDSKLAPGQTLRFVKKRSAMDRDIWACIGCIEISKRMGAILPIPEITTRRGNFVTDPDNPSPHRHYPMCLQIRGGGSAALQARGDGATLGRGARKRRSMADVERYEDTSAYDFINSAPKKKGAKGEGGKPFVSGPSINDLGLTQYKGGLANFIMGPDLNKELEKGLVVAKSQKLPGYVWLYEKLKVKDKCFYRCVNCKNMGPDKELDGEFHEGFIKQVDRKIFGNPDAGHMKGCKALPINKVVAMGLEREIVRELEEAAETGEGPSFNAAYGAAKLRVAGRCSTFKGKASTVIFALEDWKFEVEGLSLEEMKSKVGALPKDQREKSATPASSTDSRPSSVKPESDTPEAHTPQASNGHHSPPSVPAIAVNDE